MQKKFEIDTYAVMGNPIAHSKSPEIHAAFAKQTDQQLQYLKILVPLEGFTEAVENFHKQGGKGLNITLPFKQQAAQLVDQLNKNAEQSQTVNTILFRSDYSLLGENTDGIGLVRDMVHNHAFSLQAKNILLLGAGGAVQAVLPALMAEKPKQITIANRTIAKAQTLAQQFATLGTINTWGFAELNGQVFDVIINGTSASLQEDLPPLPKSIITTETFCYDMVYGDKPTVFLQWAKSLGAKQCHDGLGMLVEQAAAAFYLWRGIAPDTQSVIKLLRPNYFW